VSLPATEAQQVLDPLREPEQSRRHPDQRESDPRVGQPWLQRDEQDHRQQQLGGLLDRPGEEQHDQLLDAEHPREEELDSQSHAQSDEPTDQTQTDQPGDGPAGGLDRLTQSAARQLPTARAGCRPPRPLRPPRPATSGTDLPHLPPPRARSRPPRRSRRTRTVSSGDRDHGWRSQVCRDRAPASPPTRGRPTRAPGRRCRSDSARPVRRSGRSDLRPARRTWPWVLLRIRGRIGCDGDYRPAARARRTLPDRERGRRVAAAAGRSGPFRRAAAGPRDFSDPPEIAARCPDASARLERCP